MTSSGSYLIILWLLHYRFVQGLMFDHDLSFDVQSMLHMWLILWYIGVQNAPCCLRRSCIHYIDSGRPNELVYLILSN